MAQDFESPSAPLMEPPKRRNTALIIVIVVLIILCCCLAFGAFALTWLWNNGDRLLEQWNQGFELIRLFV